MVRKQRKPVEPDAKIKRVVISPELHRALFLRRLDSGRSVQQQVDEILGRALARELRRPEPATA